MRTSGWGSGEEGSKGYGGPGAGDGSGDAVPRGRSCGLRARRGYTCNRHLVQPAEGPGNLRWPRTEAGCSGATWTPVRGTGSSGERGPVVPSCWAPGGSCGAGVAVQGGLMTEQGLLRVAGTLRGGPRLSCGRGDCGKLPHELGHGTVGPQGTGRGQAVSEGGRRLGGLTCPPRSGASSSPLARSHRALGARTERRPGDVGVTTAGGPASPAPECSGTQRCLPVTSGGPTSCRPSRRKRRRRSWSSVSRAGGPGLAPTPGSLLLGAHVPPPPVSKSVLRACGCRRGLPEPPSDLPPPARAWDTRGCPPQASLPEEGLPTFVRALGDRGVTVVTGSPAWPCAPSPPPAPQCPGAPRPPPAP